MIQDGREFVVPSVTKILGVISKGDALVQWAANQVVSCLEEKLAPDEVYTTDCVIDLARECRYAFRKKKKEAADIGTEAHGYLEGIVRTSIVEGASSFSDSLPFIENEQVRNCVVAGTDWLRQNKIVPLYAERRVYSRRQGYSGTLDLLAESPRGPVVIDYKSSRGLYSEYNLQTAAYARAYEEETGERISGRILVRLGKEDGAFEVKELPFRKQLEADYQAFLAAKKLYDWQQKNK